MVKSVYMQLFHLIIYCPENAADAIRKAASEAGAGKIGNYDSCSFSSKGTGRFRPLEGAHPTIGNIGSIEEVQEERIEMMATEDTLSTVITAIVKAHPYEEPAIHILKMKNYKDFIISQSH